jgi:hypothetical protein
LADDVKVADPRIRRYALVPGARDGSVRRFHLVRVAAAERPESGVVERFERMEEIAELDRREPEGRGEASPG